MSETRAVTGSGDSLSVTQERDLALQMCRCLLILAGGEAVLDLDLCDRAAASTDGELVWDKVDDAGKIRVYFRPWRTDERV